MVKQVIIMIEKLLNNLLLTVVSLLEDEVLFSDVFYFFV